MNREELRKKYDFRWEVLDVLIGGKSLIDSHHGLTGFPMDTQEDAERFLLSYGFDVTNPIEGAEVLGHFHEAINFVRKYFLFPENPEGIRVELPRQILELQDIRKLLLMAGASKIDQSPRVKELKIQREWACALLKVMHGIAHIDKDLRATYFTDIQQQIFDRYYKYIHRDDAGRLFLGSKAGDPRGVELVEFQTKPKKARDSVLLKILHKPESVADEIFDTVGIRFVTKTRLDALRVVKYIKDALIIVPANIKPSRSRNSLINIPLFKSRLEEILSMIDKGQISEDEIIQELEKVSEAPIAGSENPHSSEFYRSLQFTSRQLVKLKNPLHNNLKELKALCKSKTVDEEVAASVERIDLKYIQREVRFFYPYEIQIMDQATHEENERGRGSHREYKKAQIQTAMKRVFGALAGAQSDVPGY